MLNPFLAQGPARWREAGSGSLELAGEPGPPEAALHPLAEVELLLPVEIGDYVDFYATEHHASNIGRLFRPDAEPLMPNWKHLPVGYHGRAGHRRGLRHPRGPARRPAQSPGRRRTVFGPSRRLDIEAEVGFVVGTGSNLGKPVGPAISPTTCSASA